jgi:hypothetical protein
MIIFSMKFYTYKKIKLKKNLPHQSFQFFLRLWIYIKWFKMFISTIWDDNVDGYDFLRLKIAFPLKIYLGQVLKKNWQK